MERLGEVTRVDGKWLEITFCRPSDCEKCHACMGGEKTTTLRLEGKAQLGDRVLVELPASTVTQASLIAYGLPLAGMLIGMFLGDRFVPLGNSLGTLLGAAIGLALPLGYLLVTERKRRQNPKWTPQIIRVIPAVQTALHDQ
ncbi:MAG: SoxR reducing system RseC family protein [Clostridiales bacterium]|nr:SoxR reducing system RseC family protein [Clostridiales bacterium]